MCVIYDVSTGFISSKRCAVRAVFSVGTIPVFIQGYPLFDERTENCERLG